MDKPYRILHIRLRIIDELAGQKICPDHMIVLRVLALEPGGKGRQHRLVHNQQILGRLVSRGVVGSLPEDLAVLRSKRNHLQGLALHVLLVSTTAGKDKNPVIHNQTRHVPGGDALFNVDCGNRPGHPQIGSRLLIDGGDTLAVVEIKRVPIYRERAGQDL